MSTFATSLQILLDAHPRWDLSAQAARTWAALLSDVSPALLHSAAIDLARYSKFPPTPAEWRERAEALAGRGTAASLTPGEAWDEMYRNRHARHSGPVAWSSAAVQQAARVVRWDDHDWLADQLPTIRAQFERAYVGIQAKGAAIARAHDALEFAPQVEALMGALPLLPRVNHKPENDR